MILFLDLQDGECPPQNLLPPGTVITAKYSPSLDSILKINLNSGHVAHRFPRRWLRIWNAQHSARIEILRLALGRFGGWRIYAGTSEPWDLDPRPKGMDWDDYRFHRWTLAGATGDFHARLTELGSDYLGVHNPAHLFIGGNERRLPNSPQLAYATTRRWLKWWYLCLRSVRFDMGTIGMLSAQRRSGPITSKEMETIGPRKIILMGRTVPPPDFPCPITRMPDPRKWWLQHNHLYNAEFIQILRKAKTTPSAQPIYALPPGTEN